MSFSVTGALVCVVLFYFVYPFIGVRALIIMAGLWILLHGHRLVPSSRGWVAGQP